MKLTSEAVSGVARLVGRFYLCVRAARGRDGIEEVCGARLPSSFALLLQQDCLQMVMERREKQTVNGKYDDVYFMHL